MQRLAISRLALNGEGARVGLREGDVLLSYNETALETLEALLGAIQQNPSQKAVIRFVRNEDVYEAEVAAGPLLISVEQVEIDQRLLQPITSARIGLTSGESVDVISIALVNAAKLTEAERLFSSAHDKLGNASSHQRIRFRGQAG